MSKLESRKDQMKPLALDLLALRTLDKKSTIGIYPHLRADGDAYGASFALALILEKLGSTAKVILEEAVDERFTYLPGSEKAIVWPNLNSEEQEALVNEQAMAIMLDLSVEERLASRIRPYQTAKLQKIIDHHLSELENSADIFIDATAAASCELVFDFMQVLEDLEGRSLVDSKIALNLYTGILTDTGNFSFNNVRAHTLYVASLLLPYGIKLSALTEHLFRNQSYIRFIVEAKLRLRVQSAKEGLVRYLTVSQEDLREMQAREEDIDIMPTAMRSIEDTKIAFMLRETVDGMIRVNLRSAAEFDVASVAKRFGGGGHKNASGIRLQDCSLEQATTMILEAVLEAFEDGKE